MIPSPEQSNDIATRCLGRAPSIVVPSAIGMPEPSGLSEREWDEAVERLLADLEDH